MTKQTFNENLAKVKKEYSDYINKLETLPDFNLYNADVQKQKISEYKENVRKESLKYLNDYRTNFKKELKEIKDVLNKTKYPLTNGSGIFDNITVEIQKQRAETLAMRNINAGIINIIKSEYENKNYDFIFYLKEAINNLSEKNNFTALAMKEFEKIESDLSISDKITDLKANELLLKQIDTYEDIILNPGNKLSLIYNDKEIIEVEDKLT